MILRKEVNNILSEEHPPPFRHPRNKLKPKNPPQISMEPLDSPDVHFTRDSDEMDKMS